MGKTTRKFHSKFKQVTSEIKNPVHKDMIEHMLVVNSAIEVSADIGAVVERTGYSGKFIERISIRMREAVDRPFGRRPGMVGPEHPIWLGTFHPCVCGQRGRAASAA
jgi:hypothetical protein